MPTSFGTFSNLFFTLLTLLSFTPSGAFGATGRIQKWYDVHFMLTTSGVPTQFLIQQSGQFVVPKLVTQNSYYIFPAMSPKPYTGPYSNGIFQNVLDGTKDHWWFASGFCCFKKFGWGNGFVAREGDVLSFLNMWDHGGVPTAPWTTTIHNENTGEKAVNSFPIGNMIFNAAGYAIELWGDKWDFGPLEFRNIVMISSGTDARWCNPISKTAVTEVQGVRVHVSPKGVVCTIDKIILKRPL